jgi:hypothetical protein
VGVRLFRQRQWHFPGNFCAKSKHMRISNAIALGDCISDSFASDELELML